MPEEESPQCAVQFAPHMDCHTSQPTKYSGSPTGFLGLKQNTKMHTRKSFQVIDGYGSTDSVERRLNACDTVIFVDHPIHIHFWWATKRQIKSLISGRSDGPEGCPMWRATIRLYKMIWQFHKEMRPKLTQMIYERADAIRIIHIKSPDELNAFTKTPA